MDITEIDVVDKLRYKKGSSLTWRVLFSWGKRFKKEELVIIDFETNSTNIGDVIEGSCKNW